MLNKVLMVASAAAFLAATNGAWAYVGGNVVPQYPKVEASKNHKMTNDGVGPNTAPSYPKATASKSPQHDQGRGRAQRRSGLSEERNALGGLVARTLICEQLPPQPKLRRQPQLLAPALLLVSRMQNSVSGTPAPATWCRRPLRRRDNASSCDLLF